jgi:hypothetical protein
MHGLPLPPAAARPIRTLTVGGNPWARISRNTPIINVSFCSMHDKYLAHFKVAPNFLFFTILHFMLGRFIE